MSRRSFAIFLSLLLGVGTLEALAAGPARTILVLPARQRLVQLAFQIARWRSAGPVACQDNVKTGGTLLHVWNGREWVPIAAADYASGAFLAGAPDETILVGPEDVLPPELAAEPAWSRRVRRIPSLEIADILNALDARFRFTPAEWRTLARRFDLKLQDENAERRRFGRYGRRPLPAPTEPPAVEPEPAVPELPAVEAEADQLPPPVPVEPATPPPKAVEPAAPANVPAPAVQAAPAVEPKAEPPAEAATEPVEAPPLPPPSPADK